MAEDLSITLYHAGRSTNSASALDELARLVDKYGIEAEAIEYVDVFVERRRALDDRVMMTPALRVAMHHDVFWFFGDLTRDEPLIDMLKRAKEAGP